MKRGDIVTAALSGDYGKPRPAVIIQANQIAAIDSVLLCPITTTLREAPLFRLPVAANEQTGLRQPSQIMIEKITAVRWSRIRARIGCIDDATLVALDQFLAFVVGLADRSAAGTRSNASIDPPDSAP
jgi:mRNA interferase MazF